MAKNRLDAIAEPTNGAEAALEMQQPYRVEVEIEGTADLLMHRWNCEAVEEKAGAKKGSKAKKTDDIESYVWRNESGELCIPGEYVRGAIRGAACFKQDPRSPRKSAKDLYTAAVVSLTDLAPLGVKEWHYLDKRRALVQRSAINRVRPAMRKGWRLKVRFLVTLPEYVSPSDLRDTLKRAGELIGIGDFRPTYGRFDIIRWTVLPND